MNWIPLTITWYVVLAVIGIISFPLTSLIFKKVFVDHAFPFAKTVGIILITYALFALATLHILPNTYYSLVLVVIFWGLINLFVLVRFPDVIPKDRKTLLLILCEEALFLGALFFWAYVRGQEPSIKGLEKFMDYGFMNAISKSLYFPPKDMWYAGDTINYYYFGHMAGSFLTRLSRIPSEISYNLILATLFALSVTQMFSLGATVIYRRFLSPLTAILGGLLATLLMNLGGNLHTVYLFTKGYITENPVPFWKILSSFNPQSYWYPNATRFIPYTIHEFPLYSYVVADLHGHVFDIPFVLLTLALLYLTIRTFTKKATCQSPIPLKFIYAVLIGGMTGVHYMTNAFDGPIYLLLATAVFFLIWRWGKDFFFSVIAMVIAFILVSLPFSLTFSPFASGIGVNCPLPALAKIGKIGPFLFESQNCQHSSWWMLLTLWGFYFFSAIFFVILLIKKESLIRLINNGLHHKRLNTDMYIFVLFAVGLTLIIIPEFFYIKDIYPAHFRANTMFKLGYQAFIIMSLAGAYTLVYVLKMTKRGMILRVLYIILLIPQICLISIYPFFAIRSYYGWNNNTPQLNGILWLEKNDSEYYEVIEYLNTHTHNNAVIIEAQGDSYSEYNVVSSYTGLETPLGWYVHQWLWRGTPEASSIRVPDVEGLYTGVSISHIKDVIKKYNISYIIVGPKERTKYPSLQIKYIEELASPVFTSTNGLLTLYKIK